MALFKISRGSKNSLPTTLTEGYCWYTYDDSKFYIDFKDEKGVLTRKALNATEAEKLTGYNIATILNASDVEIPTSKVVFDAIADLEEKVATKMLSVVVLTEPYTSVSAIKDAIEAAGGDIASTCCVSLSGYLTNTLLVKFRNIGESYYVSWIDLDTLSAGGAVEPIDISSTSIATLVSTNTSTYQIQIDELLENLNNLAEVATSGSFKDLIDQPELKDLTSDATHRTVTDAEKEAWNSKSNFSGSYNDLTDKPDNLDGYVLPPASEEAFGGIKVSLNETTLTISTT